MAQMLIQIEQLKQEIDQLLERLTPSITDHGLKNKSRVRINE